MDRGSRWSVLPAPIKRTSTRKKPTRSTTRKLGVAPFDCIYVRRPDRSIDRQRNISSSSSRETRTEQTGKWSKMVGLEISCLLSALYIYLPLNANAWTTWVWNFSMQKNKRRRMYIQRAPDLINSSFFVSFFFFFALRLLWSSARGIDLINVQLSRVHIQSKKVYIR